MGNASRGDPHALSSIATLRMRARGHLEQGAVTPSYAANRETVLRVLNEALATELVCVLRYQRHYHMASGPLAEPIRQEFQAHALEEQGHATLLARRIVQLEGKPDFDPRSLAERSHAEYVECETLEEMIRENLVAERVAIESYKEFIHYLGDDDPTTRRLLESILAVEEEHAEDLASMIPNLTVPAALRFVGN
jgi:bacterioferritin